MRGSVCGGRDSRRYVPLQIVSFLSETVRGDVAKFRQYASMTAVPHSSQRRPGSANATRQHVNGLLGTPLRYCMGLRVLKVSKYSWPRLVATKLRSNDECMNIERIEPPTQFRGPPRSIRIKPPSPLRLCFVDLTNMDLSSEDLNRLCDRFRVLIIGRRNAGKTTILEKMTGSEEGAKPEIRDKEGRLVVRPSLIYLTSIVKLMVIGRPKTCQGRVGGLSSLQAPPTPLTQLPAWNEHDRLRDNIPEQPTLCLPRFSWDRSRSRIRLSWYGGWRRTRLKQASYRVYSEVHR